jgi:hypothetical protein
MSNSNKVKFYSSKRHGSVNINADKVCGTRIPNPVMKKGYSDSINVGKNNGVVNQRLSRFSTEAERKTASSTCAGNVNWLNHKTGDGFNKMEDISNQFSIKRPTFNSKNHYRFPEAQSINDLNVRGGMGNRNIDRPSFTAPEIKARTVDNFSRLQIQDLQDAGEVFRDSNGKLVRYTMVKIPDATDFIWLEEERRLRAKFTNQFTSAGLPADQIGPLVDKELSVQKPLGREQRTINKKSTDVSREDQLSTKNKLLEVSQMITDGRAENNQGRLAVTGQLLQIVTDVDALNNLTTYQLQGLAQSLMRLNIPVNYKQIGIVPRFVDKDFYNDQLNTGLINLLLINRANSGQIAGVTISKPVRNLANPQRGSSSTLSSMVTGLARQQDRLYLDLEEGGVINRSQLEGFIQSLGGGDITNNPDFNIKPSNL